jgi:hypothetical protein
VYHGYGGNVCVLTATEEQIEATPVSACLWRRRENSPRLVSWWDMFRFDAHHFVGVCANIGQLLMDLRTDHIPQEMSAKIADDGVALIGKHCEELGLELSAQQAKRVNAKDAILQAISIQNPSPLNQLEASLRDLLQRVSDEMAARLFLHVPINKARYYEPKEPPFGQAVFDGFPSAIDDVFEAGNCLALDRDTAVVFHLMRVMEAGLKVLGKELGIPYAPSWESYLRQIGTIVEGDWKSKTADERARQPLYKELAGDLQAVKFAWRNPTMHIIKKYDADEAAQIYAAVKQFMNRLADAGLHE